ncbi:AAA family ATPase [Campylobacter devanensis]|uniref:AAA family ATPase n=1 Tax=Campylobacter devanensis TaxID=3161138 RepID=UPI000A354AEC|nr:AAA family ATPase [Campylobacter sp. P0209]
MIRKVNLKCASYKELATLKTDKKINLIYGLNGSGKSTFSEYMRKIGYADEKFANCSIETDNAENKSEFSLDEKILVYNQKWVKEAFYENPTLKGIFSLSKGNADAKKKIDLANQEKEKLEKLKTEKEKDKEKSQKSFESKKLKIVDSIWKIKTDYTGGERVTDQFFKGLKSNRETLFKYVLGISKSTTPLLKTIKDIQEELQVLLDKNATKIENLSNVQIKNLTEDEIILLKKEITGSKNSTFSTLLDNLRNSDWVNSGLKYVENQTEPAHCPFCQQKIDKQHLLDELKSCFDKSYEQDKLKLQHIYDNYKRQIDGISIDASFKQNNLLNDLSSKYESAFEKLKSSLNRNLDIIKEKISTPSKQITLNPVITELTSLNEVIKSANDKINDFNAKIDQKDLTIKELEKLFWENIRLQYDVIITNYLSDKSLFDKEQKNFDSEISIIEEEIKKQDNIITEQSELVSTNIDEAVISINNRLIELGINSFKIEKYDKYKAEYKLVRSEESEDNIFESLSEGEKIIISFLYFIEECRGKDDSKTVDKKKIVVIDDPISSLSHIYVFNIGTLIKSEFFGSSKFYEQIFVLTHNLYFFYELAKSLYRDKKEFNLFRIIKSTRGSSITTMKYSDIQNDYQMYWSIVNNKDNQPALIANCMRNIIEYFFGFIENNELSKVFQKKEFKDNINYQAFYRYINRESHSDNVNIYDMKEFDYDSFQEAFRKVFTLAGYEEHYNKMSKIGINDQNC